MKPSLALAALLAGSSSACTIIDLRGTAATPNPLSRGGRGAPEIAVRNGACVDQTGLVDACTSHGRLTVATTREVCVEVTLGENADAPAYVDRSRFALASSTGSAEGGQVRRRENRSTQQRGTEAIYRNTAGERGMTVVQRRDRAQQYRWVYATREVCFANDGVLTPATSWLEARVITPSGLLNWGYRWSFDR